MAGHSTGFLSVVIPALNEGNRLSVLVDWLRAEPGVGEVIIVDASGRPAGDAPVGIYPDPSVAPGEGSTDDKVRLFEVEQPGRALQMNYGASQCHYPAICFVHADSRPPHGFAILIEQALEDAEWGRFDLRIDHPAWRFRLIETMINLRSRLSKLATGDQGLFFRRRFFEDQGGFCNIPLMEDIEISKRLRKVSAPAVIVETMQTSARRWLRHGTARTVMLMWKIRFLYWWGTNPAILAKMYRNAR